MKFLASINIMPQKEILDPQGKAVKLGLQNLGIQTIENVRIGKHLTMEVEANSQTDAEAIIDSACRQLLANLIMEEYNFAIVVA